MPTTTASEENDRSVIRKPKKTSAYEITHRPAPFFIRIRFVLDDELLTCLLRFPFLIVYDQENADPHKRGRAEESRSIEYENGSGVIQFDDTDHFTWIHNMESIDQNVFLREE